MICISAADVEVLAFLNAGYFEMLVETSQLAEYWQQLGKDFPMHPAALGHGGFIDIPFAIYGTSIQNHLSGYILWVGFSSLYMVRVSTQDSVLCQTALR